IGIADNAGALASGIAGDLNGMTLISKKITLDGNTTVTGDFYAKGGNFKNINASNITVGNLDADEVRIINLDVNTLTGNVSRFLETNWDGAYGSTKITSTGMKINTQYIQADFQGFGMDFSYSNKKIGGMGISQYLNGEPGLSMRLESEGAYMAWSARNEGNSTGPYIDKLAWYRQGKPALSGNYGFIFSDRVTFNKPINIEGTSINLGFRPINLYGNLFPFFGNQDNMTGFAYTSNEIYMVLQNQYVNLSKVIKALSGLGAWSVPTNIDSTGKVTQWRNVTT
ncbi:gp58-like family protein, partial [Leuconostoc lactis]